MSENFLKFKRRYNGLRALYSSLCALGAGLATGGITLLLSRLALIPLEPIFSAAVGGAALLLTLLVLLAVSYRTDKQLARRIDRSFSLSERVETMLDFKDDDGVMLDMQRADADEHLAKASPKEFKVFGLLAGVITLVVGALCLTAAFIAPNMRDYEPPEEVIPFRLSDMQRAGINELITYTEASSMEEPYRSETVNLLRNLLSTLEVTYTQPEMRAALAEAMEFLLELTSDSSSMTEIAEALWRNGDVYAQTLAQVIDTSDWREADWGDFSEKYASFRELYKHKQSEGEIEPPTEEELLIELKWKLESSALKINSALSDSGLHEIEGLRSALAKFAGEGSEEPFAHGLSSLNAALTDKTYAEAEALLDQGFSVMSNIIYGELARDRGNTLVGEYVMTKLSTLFLVPLPAFERPDLSKGGAGSDSGGENDDKEENEGSGGGIGTGAVYGSNDLVLDPLTGEYVEYGTLLDKYFSVMSSKLESGGYTESQKEAIKKYFALLYGGMKKDEGK